MSSPPNQGRTPILLFLLWMGFLGGTVVLPLGEFLPGGLSLVKPENFFVALVEVQIFFVLFLWPLFVSQVRGAGEVRMVFLQTGILILMGLPLLLVGAWISGVGWAGFLRGQFLVASWGVLAGVVFLEGLRRGLPIGPWYLLGAFTLAGLVPYAAFLHLELGAREKLPWIVVLSPFWGGVSCVEGEGAWLQGILATAAAGLILTLRRLSRREVPS